MKIILLLNNNLNFIFLKKNNNKYILIFNKNINIYIKYKLNDFCNMFFIKNLNCISIEIKHFNKKNNVLNFNNVLNKQIKSINFYFFQKIIFFGKGYKIKKLKKNTLNLFFNRSHINFIKWNSIILKKLKKTKILIQSINYNTINLIANKIVNSRKINIFTKKGLRLSRQLIYKKVGKKTS